jgi:uncharacterized protein (TIGR02996 family)
MHEEDSFLHALLENPADDTTRLVYADWLDEQGEPLKAAKAEFIRLELRVLQEEDLEPTDDSQRLQQLAAGIEPDWLVVVSRPRIERCSASLCQPCPGRWDMLAPTGLPALRLCETCYKTIRFCHTLNEAQEYARIGTRVAVSPGIARTPNDLNNGRPIALTTEMIERLREASRRGMSLSLTQLKCKRFQLPQRSTNSRTTPSPATEMPACNTQPAPEHQAPLPKRRKGGRGRNRNIQTRG